MQKNKHLKLIDENAQWVKKQRDITEYSLNFEEFKAQNEEFEAKAEKFNELDDYTSDLSFNSLPYEEQLIEKDTVLGEKRERWHKNLKKDVYIEEAVNVLQDLREQTKAYKLANAK